jgi:hypothetical protein
MGSGQQNSATASADTTEAGNTTSIADRQPQTAGRSDLGIAGLAIGVAVLVAIVCAAPFLVGFSNIIGWIIIGIGVYEAWKINKRRVFAVTGPHALASTQPAAS